MPPIKGDANMIKGEIEAPSPSIESKFQSAAKGDVDATLKIETSAVIDSAKATTIKYEIKEPTIITIAK